jgi:hypothetical protein
MCDILMSDLLFLVVLFWQLFLCADETGSPQHGLADVLHGYVCWSGLYFHLSLYKLHKIRYNLHKTGYVRQGWI